VVYNTALKELNENNAGYCAYKYKSKHVAGSLIS